MFETEHDVLEWVERNDLNYDVRNVIVMRNTDGLITSFDVFYNSGLILVFIYDDFCDFEYKLCL